MKGQTKAKMCNIIDLTRAPFIAFGTGVKKGNPKLCLGCGQPIQRDETWRADTSAKDPDGHGRYTVIQHSPRCPGPDARKAFQKRLARGARASG